MTRLTQAPKNTLKYWNEYLFKAVDGWFNRTQDKHGDNPELMSMYQLKMANAVDNIKRIKARKRKVKR